MSSANLQALLQYTGILCMFLFAGMFLRAKVPAFRKLLLPASVIGGFLLLLLGPQVWGDKAPLAFSAETISTWSAIPGVMIVPIFASVPLGTGMGDDKKPAGHFKKNLPKILVSCGLFTGISCLQGVIGYGVHLVAKLFNPNLNWYRTFGYELGQGFAGGHGTAAGLGGILEGFGLDYWQTSMGVATTYATIGLVGGMLIGIILINRASAKGETMILDKPGDIPALTLFGFTKDMKEQPQMGRETTNNSSIESITVHLGLMLIGATLAYWVSAFFKAHKVAGLSSIPVWFYGLLLMYGVNFILKFFKLDWMIDRKIKARITGAMSDIAIIAAIGSLSVKTVMAYAVPIIITSILGFIITYFGCFTLYKFCFGKNDYPFERAIMSWGVNTGVMINGMMLLKICDPNYDSPSLEDFSMGFALMNIISLFTSPITYGILATGTTFANFGLSAIMAVAYLAMAFIGRAMLKKLAPENFV